MLLLFYSFLEGAEEGIFYYQSRRVVFLLILDNLMCGLYISLHEWGQEKVSLNYRSNIGATIVCIHVPHVLACFVDIQSAP